VTSDTARSDALLALARRVADAFPPEVVEVVVTGSVSRGVADEVSDMEMLLVTAEELDLDACFELAGAAGLERLDTWAGAPPPAQRVSGYVEGEPLELIFWPLAHAEARLEGILRGDSPANADALVHGIAVRGGERLAGWQERLRAVPGETAAALIEHAASRWGGYTPAALLTVARPDTGLARAEWLVDAAARVLTIVYALNRVWQPTTKRLAARLEPLAVKPDRLAERIDAALAEPDPRRALLVMAELQLETVRLAPSGPNVDRARAWLAEAVEVVR
jgi:predicted nucleotidyltransferase